MKTMPHFKMLSFVLVAAFLLAACTGTLPPVSGSTQGPKAQANVVAFTGIVESIGGSDWTVSGQKITLDPQVSLDPNIAIGDAVKVEANVLANGAVVALKVESSGNDDVPALPSAEPSSTPAPGASPVPSPEATTPSAPQAARASEIEVFGTVEALTATTITVNGLTYGLSSFTEFKDAIGIGDQVKLHVLSNPDGTFSIRELEKSMSFIDDNSNSSGGFDDNSNDNGSDDSSNGNSNDDSDDSNDNGDDHGGSSGPGDDD